jgi:SPX domain protein involved in polyphosphate accumulation
MLDRLQRQRFEYKYLVSEHVALGVRDFVSSYLELDEYGGTQPNFSYPVHSLYLDSPDLVLYRNTINGDRNRFKLRVRFYENADDRPVYFEIKRRANNAILKKRVAVDRSAAHDIVGGHLLHPSHLVDGRPEALEALGTFSTLMNRLAAVPQVHVSYLREAWMANGSNSVRVTMDREVRTERRRVFSLDPKMAVPTEVFGRDVVLELKFTDRFPNWFSDLVRVFGIRQGSAAKYVDGICRMGEHALYP